MDASNIQAVVGRIRELADLVYSREPQWGVERMTLGLPASPDAIERLSGKCPHRLPPSYRSFLELHDGCLNFWFRFTLLGTSGEPADIVAKEIEDAREFQGDDVVDPEGQVTADSIARFEKDGSSELFVPSHTVIGTNEGGEFLLLNERVRNGDEYEIVHYTYSGGIAYRYETFEAFLGATLEQAEQHVRDEKYR